MHHGGGATASPDPLPAKGGTRILDGSPDLKKEADAFALAALHPMIRPASGPKAYFSLASAPSFGAPVPEEPMNTFRPSRKVTSRPLALQAGMQRLSLAR